MNQRTMYNESIDVDKPKDEATPVDRLVILPVKAVTISQPFASLIADGAKFVENRTWECRYRGPIAIHAGKGTQYLDRRELREYPNGGIVAVANLLACMPLDSMRRISRSQRIQRTELTIGEVLDHEHTEGPWCWILSDVKPCKFFPCRGAQGLWDFAG